MQKRGDDRELLLHAVRVAGDRLGQIARQIKKVRVAMDAALPVLLRNAEDIRNKIQVLNAGEKFVEVGVIRNVGKLFFAGDGVICDGFPRDENLTAVRRKMPQQALMVVVLPAPLWPMKAQISPGAICSDRSSTASLSPKVFVRWLITSMVLIPPFRIRLDAAAGHLFPEYKN